MSARSPSPAILQRFRSRNFFFAGSAREEHVKRGGDRADPLPARAGTSGAGTMPKSRGAVKKYKVKVTTQKKKKVSKKLRTTLLPKAAEHWKVGARVARGGTSGNRHACTHAFVLTFARTQEKDTVRANYAKLGISAEINNDSAVANDVHTKEGVIEGRRTSKLALGTGQLQIAASGLALRHERAEDSSLASAELLGDMQERANPAVARTWMFEGDQVSNVLSHLPRAPSPATMPASTDTTRWRRCRSLWRSWNRNTAATSQPWHATLSSTYTSTHPRS